MTEEMSNLIESYLKCKIYWDYVIPGALGAICILIGIVYLLKINLLIEYIKDVNQIKKYKKSKVSKRQDDT